MKNNVLIEITNNKCKLSGDIKVLNKLYEELSIKHPNAWHLRRFMPKGWDGKIHYITDRGYFKTGLLPKVTRAIKEFGAKYKIQDNRLKKDIKVPKVVNKFGDITLRPYQNDTILAVVNNKVGKLPFPRGLINAAVNAGKTLVAASLHLTYGRKTLILLNNTDLFEQFKVEVPQLLPGVNIKFIKGGKNLDFGDLTIAMVQTLSANIKTVIRDLSFIDVVIVDEVHLSNNKTYKKVLENTFNAPVRVGLSGSPLLHKDKTKNENIISYFGDVIYTITEQELIKKGYSSRIVLKMVKGNTHVKIKGDYREEYNKGITQNKKRTQQSIDRIKYYLDRGVKPILVVGKYHEHVENLYEAISEEFPNLKIGMVHHKVKKRKDFIKAFKEGKLDILVASLIIKIGQNFPYLRYLQIASSGDSHIDAVQILGRAQRKHKSKNKVYVDDFFDEGAYLKRHSKHRISYYKKQGFKVIELYKK